MAGAGSRSGDGAPQRQRPRRGSGGRARAALAILAGAAGLCLAAGAAATAEPASTAREGRSGFVDATEALGLAYRVRSDAERHGEETESMNPEDGGLALADIDNDGRLELYVAHGHGETGRLFGYDGRRFARLAGDRGIRPAAMDRAGYIIDLDADGWADFISVQLEGVQIFRNDGTAHFEEATSRFGIRHDRATHSMAAADHDGDGDLDLFFAHWRNPWNSFRPPTQYLWRNDGRGRYEDVSDMVPLRLSAAPGSKAQQNFSYTPTFADIDDDGDPDLLLAGDFGSSQVLRNDGGAAFTDITDAAITDENGMGAAVGDVDRDGDQDWFVTSIHDPDGSSGFGRTGNRLYRNVGGGRFEDATGAAGVRAGGWGWGACLADFDNDGHPDLFHTNGWSGYSAAEPRRNQVEITEFLEDPSRLFMADGDGTFTERAAALGIDHTGQGRGVVCADYDGDGRVDIFIANHGAAPSVYRNVFENGNRWLAIDLVGRHANPRAIGARVTVRTASGDQVQEMRLGGSYLSQAPPTLHFGLGRERIVHSIEVRWPGPGNQVSRLGTLAVDRRLAIRQPAPEGFRLSVVRGAGSGLHAAGATVSIEAAEGRGTRALQPLDRRGRRRLRRRAFSRDHVHHARQSRDGVRPLPARPARVRPRRLGRAALD